MTMLAVFWTDGYGASVVVVVVVNVYHLNLLRLLLRDMVTDNAASERSKHGMVARVVAGDTTYDSAREAARVSSSSH